MFFVGVVNYLFYLCVRLFWICYGDEVMIVENNFDIVILGVDGCKEVIFIV